MDKSTARTAGSYIAMCIVEHSEERGYYPYTLVMARQVVCIHMWRRREYWRRVDEGSIKPHVAAGRYREDDYAARFSGLDSFWFRNTEKHWRGLHDKTPRPLGLS